MNREIESTGGMNNPITGMEPPKSRKKLWIFGGLGCLGVIGLVCLAGIWAVYYFGFKPMQDFQMQSINDATSMPQVEEVLGAPITPGTSLPPVQDGQQFVFRTPLKGPDGEGTLVVKGSFNGKAWTKNETYLEVNGQQIDLDTELLFDLDIDEGQ